MRSLGALDVDNVLVPALIGWAGRTWTAAGRPNGEGFACCCGAAPKGEAAGGCVEGAPNGLALTGGKDEG